MDSKSDIETGLLPEVPELGQEPQQKCTAPFLGFLYLLVFFGIITVIVILVIRYLGA